MTRVAASADGLLDDETLLYCQQLADEAPPLTEQQKDAISAALAGALARAKAADG